MHITFIRPNFNAQRASDAMQPLAFAILYGLTPPEVEVRFMDERIEPLDLEVNTDLVAMSVETFTAARAYQIADHFRSRKIPVVMGGYHPTFMPQEALQHADAVVCGDAEPLWVEVLRDTALGTLKQIYSQPVWKPLKGLRYNREIFAGKKYSPILPVQFSRGCRYACDFCSIHAFYGRSLRQRPVAEVISEIEGLEEGPIFFVDDNILSNKDKAKELFTSLIPLGRKWSCQVSIDIAQDDELLSLMAKSGCIAVLVGFESLDPRNLVQMKKKWNVKGGTYAEAIQRFYDHGMMIYGTFIFGYDFDLKSAFESTLEFALKHKFFIANFNPLTPTPGTPLYDRLQKKGRLIYDRWWLNPDFRYGKTIFKPLGMSPEALEKGCFENRKAFNRYGAIFSRALNFRSNAKGLYNLGLFFKANLVSRREIFRKQGVGLGEKPMSVKKRSPHAHHLY